MAVKQKMYEIENFCVGGKKKITSTVGQYLYEGFICREI